MQEIEASPLDEINLLHRLLDLIAAPIAMPQVTGGKLIHSTRRGASIYLFVILSLLDFVIFLPCLQHGRTPCFQFQLLSNDSLLWGRLAVFRVMQTFHVAFITSLPAYSLQFCQSFLILFHSVCSVPFLFFSLLQISSVPLLQSAFLVSHLSSFSSLDLCLESNKRRRSNSSICSAFHFALCMVSSS